jgi:hypothetical protein
MIQLRPRVLTRQRIWLGLAIAIVADGTQLLLGPLGWVFVDEAIDVVVMGVLSLVIGFHPLFLPAFLAEFIPGVDMLPTWTACVALVTARRGKEAKTATARTAAPPRSDVIDV